MVHVRSREEFAVVALPLGSGVHRSPQKPYVYFETRSPIPQTRSLDRTCQVSLEPQILHNK